jgi:ABC-type multidrug transport system fused ATPase/permease subunit
VLLDAQALVSIISSTTTAQSCLSNCFPFGLGKSSLTLAFFRIIPLAQGSIHIDGYDINRMGLHDLRSRLTMIPQDPVLFTGTIRSNLDPLSEHADEELWKVLEATHVLESLQKTSSSVNLERMGSNATLGSSSEESNITLDSPVAEVSFLYAYMSSCSTDHV